MPSTRNRDFSSLSVKDLLEAREAYHVHLAHLDGVYATAIGRYLIRDEDINAQDAKAHTDPADLPPRTLDAVSIKPWSWPCVLVFVDRWISQEEIRRKPSRAADMVPSFLYLPDGRVVPTCVVLVEADRSLPAPVEPPVYGSDLFGGGFPVQVRAQGKTHIGSIGCMVTDGDAVYALTNRHIVGEPGRELFAGARDSQRRLGVSDRRQLGKRPFKEVYPGWPGERVMANLDAGLIRIDDVTGWSAQVYGVGEIGDVWDLNVDTFRLDVLGCPLVAFGAASGEMKGRIFGLFYRYKSVGGMEYVTDFVIAPRDGAGGLLNNAPGNSGTIWFEDVPPATDSQEGALLNANGARILRPVAVEWGGQVLLSPAGRQPTQLALGVCLATVLRELDVELIPDWNIGHREYWGEWGHVKVGAYATSKVASGFPRLRKLMADNALNIGLGDDLLQDIAPFHPGDFAPLADVADLVWRFGRPEDSNNHFADMDKKGPDGETLLDKFAASEASLHPDVWNAYYQSIGEARRGALPFRVWQIFDEMVDFLRAGDTTSFLCAAGIVSHYVGDACQPLHISRLHHGLDPGDTKHAKVHSVYETTMIARHGSELIGLIPTADVDPVPEIPGAHPNGRGAARAVVQLMQRTVVRLPPGDIVAAFDSHMGQGQDMALWNSFKAPTAACMQDGARTLARIWEAAWRAGGGEALPQAGVQDRDALKALYKRRKFLQAFPLQELKMTAQERLVPA